MRSSTMGWNLRKSELPDRKLTPNYGELSISVCECRQIRVYLMSRNLQKAMMLLEFLGLNRSRQFLYHKSMRLVFRKETLISRAAELRNSIDLLKVEGEKLEKRALQVEEELVRDRTKLKQVGKQIQSVSIWLSDRKASSWVNDVLIEIPSREASRFRTQVANLDKEAKQERNSLSKEVTKISNYGISV